jgi:hypothetical protein
MLTSIFFFIFTITATITIILTQKTRVTLINVMISIKKILTYIMFTIKKFYSIILHFANILLCKFHFFYITFKRFLNIPLFTLFIYIYFFIAIINLFLFMFDIYLHSGNIELLSTAIPQGEANNNLPMDPVRWWPSGVPQSGAIIGTALLTFAALGKIPGVSPRLRVLGALSGGGVTAGQVTYHSSLENSVGFNRLMWGWSEFRRTGNWPSIDQVAKNTSPEQLQKFSDEAMKQADNTMVEEIVKEIKKSSGNNFISNSDIDVSVLIEKFTNFIFKETMQALKPVEVQGYFDDLIGQRMFIEVILLIMCLFIIILLIVFIFNVIFLLHKDKIIRKFNNKFITFYIKYQSFLSWITLIYVPIFIFMGLFTLCHGLHWLITNQIPYESLNVDLHQYLQSPSYPKLNSSELDKDKLSSLILIFSSNKILSIRRSPSNIQNKNIKKIHNNSYSINPLHNLLVKNNIDNTAITTHKNDNINILYDQSPEYLKNNNNAVYEGTVNSSVENLNTYFLEKSLPLDLDLLTIYNKPLILHSPKDSTLFESYINNILGLEQIILIFLGMIFNILIIRFLSRKIQNNKYILTNWNYKRFNIKKYINSILNYNIRFYNFIIKYDIVMIFFFSGINFAGLFYFYSDFTHMICYYALQNILENLTNGKLVVDIVNNGTITHIESLFSYIYYINISILVLIVINIIIWFIYYYKYKYNILNIILNSENRFYIFSFFCNILLFMILFLFSILYLYDIQSNLQSYVNEYADIHIRLNSLLVIGSFKCKENSTNNLKIKQKQQNKINNKPVFYTLLLYRKFTSEKYKVKSKDTETELMKIWEVKIKHLLATLMSIATLDGYSRVAEIKLSQQNTAELKELRTNYNKLEGEKLDPIRLNDSTQTSDLPGKGKGNHVEEYTHKSEEAKYEQNPDSCYYKSDYTKVENFQMEAEDKLLKNISKLDLSANFTKIYDSYLDFLSTLSPDQIVMLFNIIIGSVAISSYISVFSVLLSEKIINRMHFLEKYPRILKILQFRNNLNKKVNKITLIFHLFILLLGIAGNIFMFVIKALYS